MKGLIKTAALAALLASMSAFAQDPATTGEKGGDFASLDANGDGSVSQDEAKADATLSAKFSELDTNKDGKISSSEYAKMGGKEEKKY
jgi:Ca2+-binding EF-hand superfamily protein